MSTFDGFMFPQEDPVPQDQKQVIPLDALRVLPAEIVSLIIEKTLGRQHVEVQHDLSGDESFHLNWKFTAEPSYHELLTEFDAAVQAETKFLRALAWQKDVKVFQSPYEFAITHYFLTPRTDSRLEPPDHWKEFEEKNAMVVIDEVITTGEKTAQLQGLEKVFLDFTTEDYFLFFFVVLPPFSTFPEMLPNDYDTDFSIHSAQFLTHTTNLTLNFSSRFRYSHPWYNWLDNFPEEFWPTCSSMEMCFSGLLIDWILSFAWDHQYLQHIPNITLAGDVQPWVLEKWNNIFQQQAAHMASKKQEHQESGNEEEIDPFAIHRPDIQAIRFHGRVQGNEAQWNAAEQFPPKCACKIKCWRLEGGQVLDEKHYRKTWDEFEETKIEGPMAWNAEQEKLEQECFPNVVW